MKTQVLLSLLTAITIITTGLYYFENGYLHREEETDQQKIYDRKFFEEPIKNQNDQYKLRAEQEDSVFSIVSYEIDFMVKVDENDDNDQIISSQGSHVKGIADVYTKYHDQSSMYDIAVAYRDISLFEEFVSDSNGQSTGEGPSNSSEGDEMAMFIVSVSSETGDMSNFRVPQTGSSSKYLQWATEQLIANIFPEIRFDAYKPEFAIIEQDNFGNYKARYTSENLSETQIKLHKEYSSNDYLQRAQAFVENPEVVFQSEVIMDKSMGVAVSGHSRHLFTVGKQNLDQNPDLMTTFNDYTGSIQQNFVQQNTADDALWSIQDFINKNEFQQTTFNNNQKIQVQFQSFQDELNQDQVNLQSTLQGEDKIRLTHHHHHHALRPRHAVHKATKATEKVAHAAIKPVEVLTPKPVRHAVHDEVIRPTEKVVNEVVVKPNEKIFEATVEKPIKEAGKITKKVTKKVFHVLPKTHQLMPLPKIVFPPCEPIDLTGSSFHEFHKLSDVNILRNRVDIDMEYVDFVDHSVIASFIHLNGKPIYKIFEQRINHCQAFHQNYPLKQRYPLFQVTYPVFGIVWLTFEVRTDVDLNLIMQGQDTSSSCTYSVLPTFKAGVDAIGRASLVDVIRAGAFADGFFLDSNLQLQGELNRHDFSGKIDFKGQMKAVSMKIGFNYTRINCHMKKMMKRLFRLQKICDVQQNKQQVIYSHNSKAHNRNFFSKQVGARK